MNNPFEVIQNPGKWRFLLTKALCSSLVRSLYSGTVEVLRFCEMPVFKIERRSVSEVEMGPAECEQAGTVTCGQILAYYHRIVDDVKFDPGKWVFIADAGGLALRNIDHLIPRDLSDPHNRQEPDLYWTKVDARDCNCGGALASPGLWAVRGKHLPLVINRLRDATSGELRARSGVEIWTEVVRDLPLRKRPFEKGEVYAPRIGSVDWQAVSNAAFVTVPDWPEKEQWKFLQSLYFGTYFGDETGLMLNILDP